MVEPAFSVKTGEIAIAHKSPYTLYPILAVLIAILLYGCSGTGATPRAPRAVDGVLDLTAWQFDRDGPVQLNGGWDFYWRHHLPPTNFPDTDNPPPKQTIRVPGTWNGLKLGNQKLSGAGFATYHLTIVTGPQTQPLAFKLLDMATAFDLYLNGRRLVSCGTVGQTRAMSQPRFYPLVVNLDTSTPQLEVVVHVTNFHHRLGGMWEEIQLGTAADMRASRRGNRNLIFFLFGSILIMGIYHFALFFLRQDDRSPLYFGIFCFLIPIRVLVTGERFVMGLWPGIGWVQADCANLPLQSEAFDCALMLYMVHYLKDFRSVIESVRGVLRSGRLVILTASHEQIENSFMSGFFPSLTPIDKARFPSIDSILDAMRAAGFSDVESRAIAVAKVTPDESYLRKVESKHVSTFHLMSDDEFRLGLEKMRQYIHEHQGDPPFDHMGTLISGEKI